MKFSLKISIIASFVSIVFILFLFNNIHKQLIITQKNTLIEHYQKDLLDLKNSTDLVIKKAKDSIALIAIANNQVKDEVLVKKLKNRFEFYMKNIEEISELKYITIDGKELVHKSNKKLISKVSDKSYLNEKIFTQALINDFFISNIYFTSQVNEMMIKISRKVIDINTQKTVGVIIVSISMGGIQDIISDKLVNLNAIALLNLDNNKFLYKSSIARKIDDNALISLKSNIEYLNYDNKSYLMVTDSYKNNQLNMKFFIFAKEDNIFNNINTIILDNTILLLIIILLMGLVMFFAISYFLRPLKALIEDIQYLSNKFNNIQNIQNNDDEIQSIRLYFNNFKELIYKERKKLKEHNNTLESKIEKAVNKNIEQTKIMAQQSKMISMGEMLENIAHQWRQPLSVISTASTGMKMEKEFGLSNEKKELKTLDTINQSAQHLSKTINDFRDFFNPNKEKELFSLEKAYKETINLLESKFKNRVIEVIDDIDDVQLCGLKSELIQVIMNILNNARDILETKSKDKLRLIFINIYKKDNTAILTIKDNGGGIPIDTIDRVFEPYFTTKHKAQGTGIGLYMSMEMVKNHMDGDIKVKNEEYEYDGIHYTGASFKIILPIKDNC